MNPIETVDIHAWAEAVPKTTQEQATAALECGQVLFFPALRFEVLPHEADLLSPAIADPRSKNISFDLNTGRIGGVAGAADVPQKVKTFVARFATHATTLVRNLFPAYMGKIQIGRTSFRPVEIKGRVSSYRKDDTRLHVDAFPSTPIRDRRILRVFSNINPQGRERVWHVGAPFEEVAKKFLPGARRQYWLEPELLQALKITKSRRTAYDHYMNQLHNRMKADTSYQASVAQTEFRFPAGSSWMTFTDLVSHAAMSGQHALEQTLYLPVDAMADPERSPLRILERMTGSRLL
jgi:hypothetical protein